MRRRWALVVLCTLLLPAAALVFSLTKEPQHTAKASLLFRDPQLDQKLFGATFVGQSRDEAREAATNLELVSLDVVAARTARAVGGVSADELRRKVSITAEGQADVASIRVVDRSPGRAARIANAFAREYIKFRQQADRAKIAEARRLVQGQLDRLTPSERNGATGRSLAERQEELQILTSLQTGNAEQVQVARPPTSSSSPKTLRNTLVGALLGLALGAGAALLADRLDKRVRDPEEFCRLFGRPILAAVPASAELAQSGRRLRADAAESFRMLRANLRYFNVDRSVQSVLITSPQPGDGKTTVAWNLAAVSALAGTRTLLVEADLRRPTITRWLPSAAALGLSSVLSHQCTLEAALHSVPASAEPAPSGHHLDVLPAGPLPPNPDELTESVEMRDLLKVAEETYEFVVVDTPPTSVVSDAIPLVQQVSGVLVVGRVGRTSRHSAARLAHQLENLGTGTLGLVVNYISRSTGGYGYAYSYSYGYGYPAAERASVQSANGQEPDGLRLSGST